ncbi:MAG: hypothetical protein JW705_08810 [Methanosarcinaceae archaeon]|nr:hypothetical protein [Methanosarcinaceae archaeon]
METKLKQKKDTGGYPFLDTLEMFQVSGSPKLVLKKAVDEIPALFLVHGKVSSRIIWRD